MIVEHLRHRGRRRGQRRMFVTAHAPIRPLEPSGVRTIVRNACRRAGIERVPAHRLRHALASDLLREGASMTDISQVLRHKHLESIAIYAKADLQRLRLASSPPPRGRERSDDHVRRACRRLPAVTTRARVQLEEHARLLPKFAAHLDATGAAYITVDLALGWAAEPIVPAGSVVPAMRLLVVRGFARYMSGIDPRTEVPPSALIRLRRHRRPPFIDSDEQVLR